MPTPIPPAASASNLRSYAVGRAVSSAHGVTWAKDLAFLLGRCLPPILSQRIAAGSGQKVRGLYRRSPGASRILVTYQPSVTSTAGTATATFKLNGSIATPVVSNVGASSAGVPTTWFGDGSTTISLPVHRRSQPVYWAVYDVSALATSSTSTLEITAGFVNTGSVTVAEIPDAVLLPEAGGPGVDASSVVRPNVLRAGSGSGSGIAAFFQALDDARTKTRRHIQWSAWNGATLPSTSSAAYTALAGPVWTRARRLRVDRGNICAWYVYSHTDVGVTGATYQLLADGVSIGTVTTTGGTTVTLLGPTSVTLPVTGTGQETQLDIKAKVTAGTGSVYLDAFALIEAET